jgi:hypothetical protein
MVNLVVPKPLDASVALADDVLVIRLERDDAVTFDGGPQAAGRFANAAKRQLRSGRHRGEGARARPRGQAGRQSEPILLDHEEGA